MWAPDDALSVRGARCTALLSRRVLDGVHLYPTASLRVPVAAQASALWRIRVAKMKHGVAVGIKSPGPCFVRAVRRKSPGGWVALW
jgi:hypothetical protein